MKKRVVTGNSFLSAKEMDFENDIESDEDLEEVQTTSGD